MNFIVSKKKHRPYSPTPEVLAMGQIQITGNITPPIWFDRLRTSSGKPNAVAVTILSEIVYWYRPKEVYDEATGKLLGLKSRFKAEKLQRSYQSLSDKFGFTKRQIQDACYFLRDKGLITLEPTTVTLDDGTKLGNVLFIGIKPNAIKTLTWDSLPDADEEVPPYPFERTSLSVEDTPYPFERTRSCAQTDEPIRLNVGAVTVERTTYTEITPETTPQISSKTEEESPPKKNEQVVKFQKPPNVSGSYPTQPLPDEPMKVEVIEETTIPG